MLTGEIRSQIDRIWDPFWSGGIADPLGVIYLYAPKDRGNVKFLYHTLATSKAEAIDWLYHGYLPRGIDRRQARPVPRTALTPEEYPKNTLPDVLARRHGAERKHLRTAQSFCVAKADIAAQGCDLSLNRYKEVVHAEVAHRPPHELLADLTKLELETQQGIKELEGMLG